MPPEERDEAHVLDMIRASELIAEFLHGHSLESYATNALVRSAVERQIEIIGEAARRISSSLREAHPEIPWRPIIAQRHILAHEYGEIEDALIWRVATTHVPALLAQLRSLVDET